RCRHVANASRIRRAALASCVSLAFRVVFVRGTRIALTTTRKHWGLRSRREKQNGTSAQEDQRQASVRRKWITVGNAPKLLRDVSFRLDGIRQKRIRRARYGSADRRRA